MVEINGFHRYEPEPSHVIEPILPSLVDFRRLRRDYPEQRPFVIDGILRTQEVMGVTAPTKAAKSWFALDLAMSLADGRPFLKRFDVKQCSVLYLDAELKPDTMSDRMYWIQDKRRFEESNLSRIKFELLRRRGDSFDIRELKVGYFPQLKGKQIDFVIMDCLYKFLPKQWSENNHEDMANFVRYCDKIAAMLDCCVCVVHHTTKGTQGGKRQTDVGSGAGSFQRALDTHLTIRDHDTDGYSVLETSSRSCRSIDPVSMRFDWPCWWIDELTEAKVKTPVSAAGQRKQQEDQLAMNAILELG